MALPNGMFTGKNQYDGSGWANYSVNANRFSFLWDTGGADRTDFLND
jgi:predicted aspartyl protease